MNRSFLFFAFLFAGFVLKAQDTLRHKVFYPTDVFVPDSVELDRLYGVLPDGKKEKIRSIRIIASCDDVGSEAYNRDLSRKRAQTIALILSEKYPGVSTDVKWLGELEPESATTDSVSVSAARQNNRCTRIILVYGNQPESAKKDLATMEVGDKLVLENLLFVGGYAVLLPESFPVMDTLLAVMQNNPTLRINIIGHVCCTPNAPDGLNLATNEMNLSVKRAEAVYMYLVKNGIKRERLSYEGRGGSEPLGKGDKYDRRVEIEVRGR